MKLFKLEKVERVLTSNGIYSLTFKARKCANMNQGNQFIGGFRVHLKIKKKLCSAHNTSLTYCDR